MPPRRSARAASVTPATKAAPAPLEKAVAKRSTSNPAKRRAASPQRTPSPPPKRSRTTTAQKPENDPPTQAPASRKPPSKAAASKKGAQPLKKHPSGKLATIPETPMPQTKPYFNPLPVPPEPKRPGLQLFAWGAGNFGQFGMGPDILGELDKPKKNLWVEEQIQEGTFGGVGAGIESVAAGGLHTLFIDEAGTVWTCGVNDDAALGRITQNVPDPENPGSFLDVDELTSIPHPLKSLVGQDFRAVQVASGDSICAALSKDGDLRVWGSFRGHEGSLGFSSGLKHQFLPVPILDLPHRPGDVEKVSSIAAGSNHLLVLTTHGNIFTWGAGEQAQLGRKVLERRKIHGTVPEKITLGIRGRKAVAIGSGAFHSFAVDEKGDVWGWGLNSMGQTGTGYTSSADSIVQLPQKVKRLSKDELGGVTVVQIVGGAHHTLFLTSSGQVYACGRSNAGQLGLADDDEAFKDRFDPEFLPEPVLVTFPDAEDPIVHVSAGPHNNMAVTKGGALYCWGQGTQGELGVPDEEVRTPRIIVRKEGGAWTAVSASCGGQHTLGLFRKK
ncbi:putative RCC1 domain-containing protein [Lyophyllum shimeji]|uniref:RCC1 domain-containing protein n=1 Tax=Lyophyllum shimeji TaxID=47721 RepID=A0A9P3PDG1_LYOSH|nr:putative RCC1 domain-containing protein [Lyophyllum shimeji]